MPLPDPQSLEEAVAPPERDRGDGVARGESVQRVRELGLRELSHAAHAFLGAARLDIRERFRAARDAFREIAHALQRVGDLEGRDGLAEILRQRLLEREDSQRVLLDLRFLLIESRVGGDGASPQRNVATADGVQGAGELLLREPAKRGDLHPQRCKVCRRGASERRRHGFLLSLKAR